MQEVLTNEVTKIFKCDLVNLWMVESQTGLIVN